MPPYRAAPCALSDCWQPLLGLPRHGTAYTTQVFDGRFNWQLDPRQRLRLSVQATDIERDPTRYPQPVQVHARDVAAQLLYSYKLNPRSAPNPVFDSQRSVS